jgi:acyl phosphate:glycerol-3-phosphate acyltransferase
MLKPKIVHRVRFRLVPCIFALILGYVIGSFPTAYLLVRWKSRLDIRTSGTGNVGARNAYDVTGSRLLGVGVFLIDAAKGVIAVLVGSVLSEGGFWVAGIGGLGAILGHNYSPWLGFKGGRGLATGAGVLSVISWPVVVIWCIVWSGSYSLIRNLHISNVIALITTPVLMALIPWQMAGRLFPTATGSTDIVLFSGCCCFCILLRHLTPVVKLLKSSTTQSSS